MADRRENAAPAPLGAVLRPATAPLLERIQVAAAASCRCGVKSPQPERHNDLCPFRLLAEVYDALTAPVLWCCHIRGPDEVHAAPDYETALAWADRFNAEHGPKARELDVLCAAAPALYPWGAENHAQALLTPLYPAEAEL
jgi:hypothetical protein